MTRRRKSPHQSGFVSILGRPNSGKSTLLNALLGTKLAIVADKPQTTRTTIQGVLTLENAQVVFLDTPGIHDPDSVINRRMMQSLGEAVQDPNLILYLADATRPINADDEKALEWVRKSGAPAFLILNKIDAVKDKNALLRPLARYKELHDFAEYYPISALKGTGVEDLKQAIIKALPKGPAFFPPDHLTDQPERFLAAELIREKILALTRQEVPHSVAVLVDEWVEEGRLVRISATIHVERPGQKIIIIGTRGAGLKKIGTLARLDIEALLQRKVFLTLFVKVSPHWREHEAFLKEMDPRAMTGGPSHNEGE